MFNNHTYASYKKDLKTADGLKAFIAGGRSKTYRKIENNTVAHYTDGVVAIRLHDTDIIIFNSDNTITLNSGGWRTVTTKERMNKYTKAGISQKSGIWYLNDGSLFYDGVTINLDGTVLKPKKPDTYELKLKAIKKQAKKYASDYVQALKNGLIDYPSGGDCWYCSMKTTGGDNLGAAINNTQHIKDHMSESYFVPSLLVNAMRDAGYRDEQMGLIGMGGHTVFINPQPNLYKYIVKQLQAAI